MDTESPFPSRMYLPPSTQFLRIGMVIQVFENASDAFNGRNPIQTVLVQETKEVNEDSVKGGIVDDDLKAVINDAAADVMREARELWLKNRR